MKPILFALFLGVLPCFLSNVQASTLDYYNQHFGKIVIELEQLEALGPPPLTSHRSVLEDYVYQVETRLDRATKLEAAIKLLISARKDVGGIVVGFPGYMISRGYTPRRTPDEIRQILRKADIEGRLCSENDCLDFGQIADAIAAGTL